MRKAIKVAAKAKKSKSAKMRFAILFFDRGGKPQLLIVDRERIQSLGA
jgi:hypothetical protein